MSLSMPIARASPNKTPLKGTPKAAAAASAAAIKEAKR
jgi:hypothetical protein